MRDIGRLRPVGFFSLGLLALILTPFARVAGSIVIFLREHDRRYAAITAIVLAIMIASISGRDVTRRGTPPAPAQAAGAPGATPGPTDGGVGGQGQVAGHLHRLDDAARIGQDACGRYRLGSS